MSRQSVYEVKGRQAKCAALLAQLDRIVDMCGLSPQRDSHLVLGVIRGWSDARWTELAVSVGKTAPSDATKVMVIEALEARGARRAG